ncbi:uncharacterized protein [Periplaneta americana]|uniref:uncharacterized protein n=1 Tax=Periplaneta americana TaxID=6978 RepID=UPI0037E73DA4
MKSLPSIAIFVLVTLIFGQSQNSEAAHVNTAQERQSRAYEDQALGMIHNLIVNGSEALGIPPLDPLDIEENIHLDAMSIFDLAQLDFANLEGVHSTKLNEFTVNSFNINVLQLGANFNFTFPEINAAVDHYNLSAVLIDAIPAEADGAIKITLHGLTISGALTIGVREETQYLYLKTLSLDLSLDAADIDIGGLMGGSRITAMVSEIVSEGAHVIIEQLKPVVGQQIVDGLLAQINVILDGLQLTVSDVINCLQTGNCF